MTVRAAIRALLALVCLAAPAARSAVAWTQEVGARAEAEAQERPAVDLEEARRRWERLSPEDQERLRERYEKLRRMGETERRALERRRRYLERLERTLVERLDARDRARLGALEPTERARLLREMVADELQQEARRVEEKLPPQWMKRLRAAEPDARRHFLERFRRQVRNEWTPRAIDRLGAELGVDPAQVERWKALPPEARAQKLLELGKRHRRAAVERHGLPHDLSVDEWRRLEALPPERFFEEAMRLRAARGWEPGRPFFRDAEDEADASREGLRRVRRAGRPRPEDRLEFLHLSPEERRSRVAEHRRERLLGALSDSGLVAPQRIEAMRMLDDGAFWKRAREWNAELGLGLGSGRREEGPPPPLRGERGEHPPRRGPDAPGPRRRAGDDAAPPPEGLPRDGGPPIDPQRRRDGPRR